MADLIKYKIYKNNQFEVLTDKGFKDFKGIIIGENTEKIILHFKFGKLVCTPKHKIMINDIDYKFAKDLKQNDLIYNNIQITKIEQTNNNDLVYELLDVQDTHKYFVNGILSHQCLILDELAFVQENMAQEFWNSVIPIISSYEGTKVFVVSTPNGTGNLFHKLYTGAESGKLQQWVSESIIWSEIPGRNKKWKEAMEQALLNESKSFAQEFENQFLETGQSAVDSDLLKRMRAIVRIPLIALENGMYKIWEEPQVGHIYTIGVDVGEGIGQAASVAQILDITDLTNIKLVANYHNNNIDPYHFANVLNRMCSQWGQPYLCIERNSCGGQVIDALKEVYNYNYIAEYNPNSQRVSERIGIYNHTNTKYKGVTNMRYWVNSLKVVDIYDIGTIQEMETFVRHPNGTWKKRHGDYIYDDRVMSLIWALFILEPEMTSKYYEIAAWDDNGMPLKINHIHVPNPEYYKLDQFFQKDPEAPLPFILGQNPDSDDMNSLKEQGWVVPQ